MARHKTVCILTEQRIHAVALGSCGQSIARAELDYIIPAPLCHDDDMQGLAEAITQSIHALGVPSYGVTLVLPLHCCFYHLLEVKRRGVSAQTLEYAFEEFLPMPLDDLTCAFAPLGSSQVLAVAVPTSPMGKLLQLLEVNGIDIDGITVDALAVALSLRSDAPGVLIHDAKWTRLAAHLQNPEFAVISAFGCDQRNLPEELQRRGLSTSPTEYLRLCLCEETDRKLKNDRTKEGVDQPQVLCGQEALDMIATAAAKVSSLDLRTGALLGRKRRDQITKLIHQVLVAGILLLITLCTQLYWNRQVLRRQHETIRAEQLLVYRDVFTTTHLPPAAALRLASECVRLQGLTQVKSPDPVEKKSSPLDAFRDFVAALPNDVRVMLLDARLDDTQWTLRGQTVEHRDAERIVETLTGHAGLSAKPPRTTRLPSGGVEFTVVATGVDWNHERIADEP